MNTLKSVGRNFYTPFAIQAHPRLILKENLIKNIRFCSHVKNFKQNSIDQKIRKIEKLTNTLRKIENFPINLHKNIEVDELFYKIIYELNFSVYITLKNHFTSGLSYTRDQMIDKALDRFNYIIDAGKKFNLSHEEFPLTNSLMSETYYYKALLTIVSTKDIDIDSIIMLLETAVFFNDKNRFAQELLFNIRFKCYNTIDLEIKKEFHGYILNKEKKYFIDV